MKNITTIAAAAWLGICLGFTGGCTEPASPGKSTEVKTGGTAHVHGEHGHPATGPHAGALIELGKEEYHAELVHDDAAGTVTAYILDHHAKEGVAINAKELRINLKHDGKGKQFKLAAVPQEGDETGKASRFVSQDKELGEDLDREGAEARLVVEIDGKSFIGTIEHDHDHHGHDHKE